MEISTGAITCILMSLLAHVHGVHFQGGTFSWRPVNLKPAGERGVSIKLVSYYMYLTLADLMMA